MSYTVLNNEDLKTMCDKDPTMKQHLEYLLSRYNCHRLNTGKTPNKKYTVMNWEVKNEPTI